ncbi:type II toxin-antitoxin system Phd/YefM family antitoxin [Georgenia sunbinii]|uniref:type II toxin-antitoxin system Phd/YefM family antitoxin n=1 Tax=Georgenia sunbinii TaxID=3117728 RepID=UPI003D9C01D0
MSYTESRRRYAEVLDSVVKDREEIVITRAGHESVVIISLEDFESLRETAHLMRSPANARRLLDAMERLEAGNGETHDLIEHGSCTHGHPPALPSATARRIVEA